MAKSQSSDKASSAPAVSAPESVNRKKSAAKPVQQVTAVEMGARQREISVSEFFTKNRHLLGFDNPRKALLTCVKEAVDNSLDACEEAGILPEITVIIEDLQPDRPATAKSSRYRVTVVDNGPDRPRPAPMTNARTTSTAYTWVKGNPRKPAPIMTWEITMSGHAL